MFTAFVTLSVLGFREPWAPIIADYQEIPFPPETLANLTPRQQRGAALFNSYGCHACHAVGPYGGHSGPALSGVGSRYERAELVVTILRGRGNMPAFAGTIGRDELDDLVAFLETLRRADERRAF